MRTCTSGTGSNTTSAVASYLAANRQLLVADLFVLKTWVQGEAWSQYVKLTTSDSPLRWDGLPYVDPQAPNGVFAVGKLKRSNIDSKIGLDVESIDLEWYLSSGDIFCTVGSQAITQLQAFAAGLWDNGRVAIYRTVMPTFGDANTYGAMCMFAGRIAEVDLTRTGVKLKVNALTEVFDQQLPPNVIEPSNTLAKYSPGAPPPEMGSTRPLYQVQSGSTATEVIANCINGGPFPPNTFESGYILFVDYDSVGASMAQIARTVRWDDGNGTFHLLEPLPWAPEAGCYFVALVPYTRAVNPATTVQRTVPVDTSGPGYDSVTVPGSFVADVGVAYTDESPLTKVDLATLESASAGGVYAVEVSSGVGTYWFWTGGSAHPGAGGDAGNTVNISYQIEAPDGAPYMGFPYVPQASNGA